MVGLASRQARARIGDRVQLTTSIRTAASLVSVAARIASPPASITVRALALLAPVWADVASPAAVAVGALVSVAAVDASSAVVL